MAAAMLAVATVAFAQAKPDFNGSWTPEAPAAGAEGGGGRRGGAMMGGPMTVTQTADTLTIEQTRGENKIVSTYKLDGTPSENKMMGRGGEVVTKSTAKWDGDKLVISTERPGQDGTPMTTTQTWSLEGGNLVIERPGREGAVNKTVYKKTT
ncbi:MAG TPA: hypothetical protein VHG52_02750 [Thermomicrobiales bacterium]|nr:hypothetical protein [Thermomicrobiales bacterium]